ncbi:hypothetical protein GYH30_006214 [Glycine max]|uniref:Uncharacterized protein n=1 Tax=Glycine soja TaxID=3848 RepID=A0A445L718_GLYSO|nr:hypothetical protein GYH30_006214 [Glycine max]RZC19046.1 hypothetical protein D0Y65_006049 [Glycine soja]
MKLVRNVHNFGLKDIIVDEIGGSSTKRKPRLAFAIEKDTHIISSWLTSQPIQLLVLIKQKKHFGVQKFKGHYKQAISLKKSDCIDNNVMLHAYAIWKEDEGKTLIEDSEANTSSQIVRPMGQKATKRKRKGKYVGISINPVDLTGVEEAMRERNILDARLAVLREKKLENEY